MVFVGKPCVLNMSSIELEVVFKAVKLACIKAAGVMMSNNLSKNCICAALIASRILTTFDVKYTIKVGYTHMEGSTQSTPHIWLETRGAAAPLITDLTFSGPYRKILILNWAVGFHDDAIRPLYTDEPAFPEQAGKSLPIEILKQQAEALDQYLERAPGHVKAAVQTTMEKALDGTDKLELTGIASDFLSNVQIQ